MDFPSFLSGIGVGALVWCLVALAHDRWVKPPSHGTIFARPGGDPGLTGTDWRRPYAGDTGGGDLKDTAAQLVDAATRDGVTDPHLVIAVWGDLDQDMVPVLVAAY